MNHFSHSLPSPSARIISDFTDLCNYYPLAPCPQLLVAIPGLIWQTTSTATEESWTFLKHKLSIFSTQIRIEFACLDAAPGARCAGKKRIDWFDPVNLDNLWIAMCPRTLFSALTGFLRLCLFGCRALAWPRSNTGIVNRSLRARDQRWSGSSEGLFLPIKTSIKFLPHLTSISCFTFAAWD